MKMHVPWALPYPYICEQIDYSKSFLPYVTLEPFNYYH